MLVAIILIVHSFGLSAAFQYRNVSTVCLVQFSNATGGVVAQSTCTDRNQQQ